MQQPATPTQAEVLHHAQSQAPAESRILHAPRHHPQKVPLAGLHALIPSTLVQEGVSFKTGSSSSVTQDVAMGSTVPTAASDRGVLKQFYVAVGTEDAKLVRGLDQQAACTYHGAG